MMGTMLPVRTAASTCQPPWGPWTIVAGVPSVTVWKVVLPFPTSMAGVAQAHTASSVVSPGSHAAVSVVAVSPAVSEGASGVQARRSAARVMGGS